MEVAKCEAFHQFGETSTDAIERFNLVLGQVANQQINDGTGMGDKLTELLGRQSAVNLRRRSDA